MSYCTCDTATAFVEHVSLHTLYYLLGGDDTHTTPLSDNVIVLLGNGIMRYPSISLFPTLPRQNFTQRIWSD